MEKSDSLWSDQIYLSYLIFYTQLQLIQLTPKLPDRRASGCVMPVLSCFIFTGSSRDRKLLLLTLGVDKSRCFFYCFFKIVTALWRTF